MDFYPRPPGGGRLTSLQCLLYTTYFYPRPPGGGRRENAFHKVDNTLFLSTPSGWRATLVRYDKGARNRHFYPRPPGGGRQQCVKPRTICSLYFYPRPPGGGRLPTDVIELVVPFISIHALRVEGDELITEFVSSGKISIHALRVEGDLIPLLSTAISCDFYPRPPGGGRPLCLTALSCIAVFLSTPSGWRATKQIADALAAAEISIHALRVEGDKQGGKRR